MAKCDTTLGQVGIWSDLQVRLTFCQRYPPQMRLLVRLTCGQTLGQADLWSDVPPGRGILWPSVILLWVR